MCEMAWFLGFADSSLFQKFLMGWCEAQLLCIKTIAPFIFGWEWLWILRSKPLKRVGRLLELPIQAVEVSASEECLAAASYYYEVAEYDSLGNDRFVEKLTHVLSWDVALRRGSQMAFNCCSALSLSLSQEWGQVMQQHFEVLTGSCTGSLCNMSCWDPNHVCSGTHRKAT